MEDGFSIQVTQALEFELIQELMIIVSMILGSRLKFRQDIFLGLSLQVFELEIAIERPDCAEEKRDNVGCKEENLRANEHFANLLSEERVLDELASEQDQKVKD